MQRSGQDYSGRAAVILLSGGLDSATALAIAQHQGFECAAITLDYGQRHRFEIEAARRVAHACGVRRHVIVPVDLHAFRGSALTDESIDVPKDGGSRLSALGSRLEPWKRDDTGVTHLSGPGGGRRPPDERIPVTYVPARNTVFLALAVAYAESIVAYDIFIGANVIDYSGYPDCRPEFLRAFEQVANLGTKAGAEGVRFAIHAPLIRMTKAEIIRRGMELGMDYALTHSCYDPEPGTGRACGRCDSCILRARGFAEAGVDDPALAAAGSPS